MRISIIKILAPIIGVLIVLPINAQRRKKFDLLEGSRLTPMVGVNMFYGDLVDKSRTSYSLGLSFEREINQYLSARTHLMAGQMKGKQFLAGTTDQFYAYFENVYAELGFGVTFKPLDLALGYYKQRSFNPYVVGQIGGTFYAAQEWYGNGAGTYPDWHPSAGESKEDDLWHEETSITPVFTLGGGVSYWLNPRISLRAEFLANQPVSDMLDAHKEWDDAEGVIHKTDNIDFYYTATVGVSFILKDSKWRNEPKYNRKAYIKVRKYQMGGSSKKSKYKPSTRRR